MKPFVILTLIFSSFSYLHSQTEIDYHHKSIKKTLQGYSINKLDTILYQYTIRNDNQGQFFKTDNSNNSYLYIGRVETKRTPSTPQNNYTEYFDYLIIFDKNKRIEHLKIINYQASKGQAITNKGWLKQFIGYKAFDPLVIHKDIDVVSGATLSTNALIEDIKKRSKELSIFD